MTETRLVSAIVDLELKMKTEDKYKNYQHMAIAEGQLREMCASLSAKIGPTKATNLIRKKKREIFN